MRRIVFILFLSLIAPFSYSAEEVIGEPLEKAGTRLDLPSGDQLQLAIDEKLVVGHFVDKDGNLIKSPANSILIIIDQNNHRNDEWRTVIKPVDEAKLTSTRKLAGPYIFRARVIIRFTDGSTKAFPTALLNLNKKTE